MTSHFDIVFTICAVNIAFIVVYFALLYIPRVAKAWYGAIQTALAARKASQALLVSKVPLQRNTSSQISETADFIARFEGFRSLPYKDLAGNLTIGYGHRIGASDYPLASGITEPEARVLLETQLEAENYALATLSKAELTRNQDIALGSFIYNIGLHAFTASTLLKKINAGSPIEEIKTEFLRWDHVNGQVIPGLLDRRKAEAELYATES